MYVLLQATGKGMYTCIFFVKCQYIWNNQLSGLKYLKSVLDLGIFDRQRGNGTCSTDALFIYTCMYG